MREISAENREIVVSESAVSSSKSIMEYDDELAEDLEKLLEVGDSLHWYEDDGDITGIRIAFSVPNEV